MPDVRKTNITLVWFLDEGSQVSNHIYLVFEIIHVFNHCFVSEQLKDKKLILHLRKC